jgi:senataxin
MLELPALQDNSALRRLRERDDARRRGLRMKPDISSLHRTILSWAYDHSGPDPPSSTYSKVPPARVPDHFSNYRHFQSVFEPLLFLECWAQIHQSKEEPMDMFECKIGSRQFVDDFVDFDLAIIEPLKKGWWLSDTDIILLRQPGGKQSVMGKVLNFKANMFGQQHANQNTATGSQHATQVSVRCHFGNRGDSGPQIGTTLRDRKGTQVENYTLFKRTVLILTLSLSTLHREYAALMAMPHYDCADFILKPNLPKPVPVDHKEVRLTMTKYNVNEPQARAISSALRTDGFSLIQGYAFSMPEIFPLTIF